MQDPFLPNINKSEFDAVIASGKDVQLFELLVEPLHEELFRRQNFDFLDCLSDGQRLLLSYDYILNQVLQGGFIQLFVNGYVGLLPELPSLLQRIGAHEMSAVLDDALKAYVTRNAIFRKDLSMQEFAGLYDQLPELAILDHRFEQLNDNTITAICNYAKQHLHTFALIQ